MNFFWVVAALAIMGGEVCAQSPAVSRVSPAAALPGKTTAIVFTGSNLREATGVWTSFPATVEFLPVADGVADQLWCRLTVPQTAPVGVGGARLVTKRGVSALQLFMVDDLPTVAACGTNHSRPAAQKLTVPCAVEGACDDGGLDYYKISAKAGQTLSIEIMAQRIGSPLDPVLRMTDANGREAAFSDDDPGIGADARFTHKFAVKGDYFIEVRDLNYQGGPRHKYRLRIGDFPLATVPFPMGAKAGSTTEFVLTGRGMEGVKPVSMTVPAEIGGLTFGVKNKGGKISGTVSAVVGRGAEFVEAEPNDMPALATKIEFPGTVNGRFLKANDRDFFEFTTAKKGEKLLITANTRALGSPSDILVKLQKADGSLQADASDGSVTNTLADAGTYRLLVEDVSRRGGPEQGYRIELERYQGFSLGVNSDQAETEPGGTFSLKISAERREFKEAIVLAAQGLPAGAVLENATIAKDKNETLLKVKLPDSVKPGAAITFRLSGSAQVGGVEHVETVSTKPAMRSQFSSMPNPPVELDGVMVLGIVEPKPTEKK